jgi:hypothetical protein
MEKHIMFFVADVDMCNSINVSFFLYKLSIAVIKASLQSWLHRLHHHHHHHHHNHHHHHHQPTTIHFWTYA